jgi:epoxide hydrolase-like predicted phosphatase
MTVGAASQDRRRFDAVIFDMGGVLTRSFGDMMASRLDALAMTVEQFLPVALGPLHEDTDHPWHRLERGEISFDDYVGQHVALARAAGFEAFPDPPTPAEMFDHLHPAPAMIDFAREVRAAGYRTAICTNNVKEFDGWQRIVSADEIADVIVDSCRVGMRKPSVGIFLHTLEVLGGLAPERALFLDDFAWNIAGAQQAGLTTVHVTDGDAAIAQVRALLGDVPGDRVG